MNLSAWLKESRLRLARHCVALFGLKANGVPLWGTGILVDFRGTPLVLTCAHVLDPIAGTVYVTTGRFTYQTEPVYGRRFSDARLDWGALVIRDRNAFTQKQFVSAADALLEPVGKEEPVLVHGFPVGHPSLQVGGHIDVAASSAKFRSMTYLTLTGTFTMRNSRLGREQPLIEWNAYGNRDAKRFEPLKKNLSPSERGGLSGGPLFLADGRRLAGQVTDASAAWLWYNPIADVLRALDSSL